MDSVSVTASQAGNAGLFTSVAALVLMVAVMAALPWLLKRLQQHRASRSVQGVVGTQVLSTVVVGPNQRVVTVEVGVDGLRTYLVLGITQQQINCLHVLGSHSQQPVSSFNTALGTAFATPATTPQFTEKSQ